MKRTTLTLEKFGVSVQVRAYLVPGPWPWQTICAYRPPGGDWVAIDHASGYRLAIRVTRGDVIEAARVALLKLGERLERRLFKKQSPPVKD